MHKYLASFYSKGKALRDEFASLSPKTRQRIYIALLIALIIALIGIGYRMYAGNKLHQVTEQQAILNVTTIKATHGPKTEEIVLPGNVQAWHEATIYARTNGYIKTWYTDIGAHVKKGELLAVIETPEVDAQLLQAQADLKTAQANNELAQSTNKRWQNLLQTESVSQQDADEKKSSAIANVALVAAAQANVDRLRELVGFQQVIAPFDGIITDRTIDIGSLINEGSSNTQQPLFSIVQSDRLRVYVKVPQNYSAQLSADMIVNLVFTEHPGKTYPAKLLSTADGIDATTRTLLAEFVVDNAQYELLPGSYTQVHFELPIPNYIVRLPVNTLLFRAQGLQVGTIDSNGTVVLKSIQLGRDFGDYVEVVSGVSVGEEVILNPSDSLITGQKVNVIAPAAVVGE